MQSTPLPCPNNPSHVRTAGGRYSTYGQLTGDLRRMLLNAIAYNKKHMDTDSTGLSKAVYDAAIFLQEKVRHFACVCVFVFVSSPTALRHLDSFYNPLISPVSSAVFTILISHLLSSLSSIVDSFPLLFLLNLLYPDHHPLPPRSPHLISSPHFIQLERLLNNFSVDVADKILRGQLINEERVKKEVTQIQQTFFLSSILEGKSIVSLFSTFLPLLSHLMPSVFLPSSHPPCRPLCPLLPISLPSLSLSLNFTAQNVARLREMEIDEELKKYRAEVRTAL
jgi:hypothetical protein